MTATMTPRPVPGHKENHTRLLINTRIVCQWWSCTKKADWRIKDVFNVFGQKGIAFYYVCDEHHETAHKGIKPKK